MRTPLTIIVFMPWIQNKGKCQNQVLIPTLIQMLGLQEKFKRKRTTSDQDDDDNDTDDEEKSDEDTKDDEDES